MAFLPIDVGPELVRRLLPQKPPFLMVDRVNHFDPEGPAARASRFLTANEPVFGGHFPGLALLPGALMVEGASQCASLAYILGTMEQIYVDSGRSRDEMLGDLANLEQGFTFHPGYRPRPEAPILAAFAQVGAMPLGVSGGIQFKFLKPVQPGCELIYEARLTHRLGEQLRFKVSATARGELVMTGTLAAAIVPDLKLPPLFG
ncbi:MAG: hypothetical protein EP330_00220 [Deltaproteobacteria bacterium]|nr:MAG: hypothetical protein EP330_00220 [Deltaproteobacteria bacterium]